MTEEQRQESVNKIWSILDGETTIAEAMTILGANEKDIKAADKAVKKDKSGATFNKALVEIKMAAYTYLKYLEGIDITKIFNLTQKSFTKEPIRNDIGIKDEELYLYQGEWVKWQ